MNMMTTRRDDEVELLPVKELEVLKFGAVLRDGVELVDETVTFRDMNDFHCTPCTASHFIGQRDHMVAPRDGGVNIYSQMMREKSFTKVKKSCTITL